MLRRLLRRTVHSARQWLDLDSLDDPHFASPLFSWLNREFTWLLQRSGCNTSTAWGVLMGAAFAKQIGISRTSMIEFGVAGGNGLLALEAIAGNVEQLLDVRIDL